MKNLTLMLALLMFMSTAEATALIEKNASIAVMDLGTHTGNADSDLYLVNADKAASEYIIYRLIDKHHLNIIDKELIQNELNKENLNTTSLIDPDTARRIGEILGVDYIVYGNVLSITLEDVDEITVRINTRIMEVKTGKIIMAAKGLGNSQSAFFTRSSLSVKQEIMHNALKKAAFQAVDTLISRLYKDS